MFGLQSSITVTTGTEGTGVVQLIVISGEGTPNNSGGVLS